MKMFNKIVVALIILIFAMSFVASANVDDFKYPNTFQKADGDSGYINDMGHGMIVYEYDDSSRALFLTNHDQYAYEFFENNYYAFADTENNMGGLLEVVEYRNVKYIVISTILLDKMESDSGYVQQNLEEFNKLNNVKPSAI